MIILTIEAITQLKKILENKQDQYVRVAIAGGGCSGFEYKLCLLYTSPSPRD